MRAQGNGYAVCSAVTGFQSQHRKYASSALVRKDRRQKPDSACVCFVENRASRLDHFDNLT